MTFRSHDIEPLSPQWHEEKKRYVSASEMASLFYQWDMPDGTVKFDHIFNRPDGAIRGECLSPYKSGVRLYHEKKGTVAGIEDNFVLEQGRRAEDMIAGWSADKHPDWHVTKAQGFMACEESGLAATLDYIAPGYGNAPVDCKLVHNMPWRKHWLADGDTPQQPYYHFLQLQTQMMAVGADVAINSVWVPHLGHYEPECSRNQAAIEMITEAAAVFLEKMRTGEEPDVLLDCTIAPDLYPSHDGDTAEEWPEDDIVTTYKTAGAQRLKWEKAEEAARFEILARARSVGTITTPRYKIAIKESQRKACTIERAAGTTTRITVKENSQ